jgi:hypothetical protein
MVRTMNVYLRVSRFNEVRTGSNWAVRHSSNHEREPVFVIVRTVDVNWRVSRFKLGSNLFKLGGPSRFEP